MLLEGCPKISDSSPRPSLNYEVTLAPPRDTQIIESLVDFIGASEFEYTIKFSIVSCHHLPLGHCLIHNLNEVAPFLDNTYDNDDAALDQTNRVWPIAIFFNPS